MPPPSRVIERRKKLTSRFEAMKQLRATWLTRWRDIADHQRPHAFRENRSDVNDGRNKQSKIINFTPIEAARTLASGMMAGITSPSRPWFRLTVAGNTELREAPAVKTWLSDVERTMREDFARSNLYKAFHLNYADLGPFGVSTLFIDEDAKDGARCYVFPVGSYCLATSPRGDVDTLFREVSLTVSQVVRLFGLANCSAATKEAHKQGRFDERVDLMHVVMPNDEYVEGTFGFSAKPWASCWWEVKASPEEGFLRESGYEERPFMAPRWEVTGEDVYPSACPGMAAQGDCRALQLLERRSAQATDKVVNPTMAGPAAAKNTPISLVPGTVNFIDGLGAGQALRPAYEINPNAIQIFEVKIERHERRVRKAYYADLWLLLSESTGTMTAREVMERREEKMLQLGTVLESLQDELLSDTIDRYFALGLRAGRFPPPPRELEGVSLKVEYISILAQAQKLLSTTAIERIAQFTLVVGQQRPEVLDKLDLDQVVDELADSLGVPPAIIRADEVVEALRQARAEAQQAQAQQAQVTQAAQTAKTLSETDTSGDNALNELSRAYGAR